MRAPAARHRRPADGRHERGRRPVRRRQDVPAAGGEIGARDETGGGASAALHRSRQAGRRRAKRKGKIVMATVKGDVHDIGKNIVGVVLRLQRLRSHRPRRDGAGAEDSRRRARAQGRHHRPVRADHALAGRNGARRQGDAAPGLHDSAADRRRDHLARPHRGQDRAELRTPGGVREGRLARGRRLYPAAVERPARRVCRRREGRLRRHPRAPPQAQVRHRAPVDSTKPAPTSLPSTGRPTRRPSQRSPACTC